MSGSQVIGAALLATIAMTALGAWLYDWWDRRRLGREWRARHDSAERRLIRLDDRTLWAMSNGSRPYDQDEVDRVRAALERRLREDGW